MQFAAWARARVRAVPLALLLVAPTACERSGPHAPASPALASTPRPAPGPAAWSLEPRDLVQQPLEPLAPQWLLPIVSGAGVDEAALREGFSVPEADQGRPYVWALGPRARVRFPLEEPAAVVLEARVRPFVHPGAPPQLVELGLNGTALTRFAVPPGGARHEVALPPGALRVGWNEIELRPAWSARPVDVIPGSADPRPLGFAVEELRLVRAGPPIEAVTIEVDGVARDALAQSGDGAARWILRAPAGTRLELGWLAPREGDRPVSVRIRAETEAGVETLWSGAIASDGRAGARSLELPAGDGALRLYAEIEGLAPGSRWIWTSLALHRPGASPPAEEAAPSRAGLNVVLVILDAAQRARFGVYGNERGTTPSIDALAREGLVFDDAVTTAPYTLAATASLFTGRTPPRHGVIEKRHRLGPDARTLAEAFRDAGYATAAFSANIFVTRRYGMDRGFDTFEELFRRPGLAPIVPAAAFDGPVHEWLRAAAGPARAGERPFFLYLHYIQPHEPYDVGPPDAYTGLDPAYRGPVDGKVETIYRILDGSLQLDDADRRQLARLYEGNLRYADAAVGRLVDELRALDLLENTLLLVTSDHGEALGERGLYGHNSSVDETMTAIPLVVRLPEGMAAPRGRRLATPVSTVDLAPLALETAGLTVPPGVEGRNPLRTLAAEPGPARIRYARTAGARPDVAIWLGATKCVLPADGRAGRVGPTMVVDAASADAPASPLAIDLCHAARRAFEADTAEPPSLDGAGLTAQEREVLKALGYVRE